jgi:ectoine hydroxylase-related dioxygenase (phytanoyl-CoA dioxygenase family)
MTGSSTLTPQQLADFDRRGLLRLPGLLSAERVRRAREYVQERLALVGLWRDGAWRLNNRPGPQWPDSGVKASKVIGNRNPAVEALIDEPALLAAVDVLLEARPFDRHLYKRPQVLFTLPNIDVWTIPTGWHVDGPRLASGRRPGVQLFACLDTVEPGGGGTLVIAGSHRLLNEGRAVSISDVRRRLCRVDYFRQLYAGVQESAEDPARLLTQVGSAGDIELAVVELTGAPGDAWLIDLRLLHAAAPNASDRPRLMATHRFWRVDVMAELVQAFAWP